MMNLNMKILKSIIKEHRNNIIMFFLLINLLILFMAIFDSIGEIEKKESQIKILSKSKNVQKDIICEITGCNFIIDPYNKEIFKNDNDILVQQVWYESVKSNVFDNIYFINTNIAVKYNNVFYTFDFIKLLNNDNIIYLFFLIIIMIVFIVFLYKSVKSEKETAILQSSSNEALLTNKSMIILTENIHHELNTPLEVIDNKVEKMFRIINKYLESNIDYAREIDDELKNMLNDFEYVKTSSEQIYNILEKMKGFKNIRYSNGNKSILDIFENAFKIISISNSNFEFKIDDTLANYSVHSKNFKNADLLGIIINNIKNSLEANASKIYVLFNKFEDNKIKVRIIDNGSGIPSKAIKHIFEPNFSTKAENGTVRGNGMFLSKQLLTQAGGNVYIVETSNKGTTIELVIPIVKRI